MDLKSPLSNANTIYVRCIYKRGYVQALTLSTLALATGPAICTALMCHMNARWWRMKRLRLDLKRS